MEYSKSLAPHTGRVFEAISRLKCIIPYTLVGGTALSLQILQRVVGVLSVLDLWMIVILQMPSFVTDFFRNFAANEENTVD